MRLVPRSLLWRTFVVIAFLLVGTNWIARAALMAMRTSFCARSAPTNNWPFQPG